MFGIFKKKEENLQFKEQKELLNEPIALKEQKISGEQIQIPIDKRIEILESKIENLKIYLEMINSKLDRLEALLKAKGFV